MVIARMCFQKAVDNDYAYDGPDTMDYQLKHVFKNICRKPNETERCVEPLKTIIMSCVGKVPFLDNNIGTSITFQYICKDEAQTFAGLIADPNQMTCMENILLVLILDECDLFQYLSDPTSYQAFCKEAERNLDCLFENTRRRCKVYDLLNYTEDLAYTILDSVGVCESTNDEMQSIKLEL